MGLCAPGDKPTVDAAVAEFLKICDHHGVAPEQILQVCIAVAGVALEEEAKGDRDYGLELVDRFMVSLKSTFQADHESLER